MKEIWRDPLYREKIVQARMKLEDDPEYKVRFFEERAELKAKKAEALKKLWQDPEYRDRQTKSRKRKWQDPEFREKRLKQVREMQSNPEFRQKWLDSMKKVWEDPNYSEKHRQIMIEVLANEEYQQRRKAAMDKVWADPEFRKRQAAASSRTMTRLNKETDQLQKAAEGIRKLRAQPDSAERFHLPTIQGYRKDIDYFAQSAWEANVARVLMYTGREFYPKESFILAVSGEYKDLFQFDITQLTLDFIVADPRGNIVAYDLIAHPLEDPVGLAKGEMFKDQYPEINL
ncbi:MAG: hypothetical protein ACD_80C00175G0001, partial [uncultured bacterium (gcode 4)]